MIQEIIINFVKIAYMLFDIIIIIYALYYIITGLFAFKANREFELKKAKRGKNKFAILIPARNEGDIIENLINSIMKQKYDKNFYDIYVIANNCTDNTIKICKELKVNVIECVDNIKNKGDALRYAFSYLKNEEKYQAYVIFDADNVVHPKFLSKINIALNKGYDVVQGNRESKNPNDTWISSSYTLFYLVQNYFFNRARVRMGFSSSINGTGFAVTKNIIDKYGFETKTITEDIEYAGICSLNNVKIYYEEEAITYDEQPIKFDASVKQRKRWSLGTIDCMNKYSSKLTKNAIKNKKFQSFDMALFYMAPIIQIITFFVIMSYMFANIIIPGIAYNKVFAIVFSYITCVVFSFITLKLSKKKIRLYLKGIFTLPFFMVTWIPINIMCLFVKEITWEKIKHTKKIDIESIIKS